MRCHHETSYIVHWVRIPSGQGGARPSREQALRRSGKQVLRCGGRRTCGPWDCGPETSASRMPRVLCSLKATRIPCEEVLGEEGVVSSGVFDHSTHEEDGPVTWEALAAPRRIPVRRRAGDPSPTHDTSAGTRVVGPRGTEQASASREATARGTGAVADGGRESEGCRRAGTSGNGLASGTRPSKGGPC